MESRLSMVRWGQDCELLDLNSILWLKETRNSSQSPPPLPPLTEKPHQLHGWQPTGAKYREMLHKNLFSDASGRQAGPKVHLATWQRVWALSGDSGNVTWSDPEENISQRPLSDFSLSHTGLSLRQFATRGVAGNHTISLFESSFSHIPKA